MLPLFDLMMKAQNGQAMEALSRQFGLAQGQMTEAMAALLPAFSTGLKRTATNPYDFSALMATVSSGSYAKYFEDLTKAFSPQGINDGNAILGRIFGSKEVSRAIAEQAAQISGIGQDVYKQMLPVIANTMVGGFFKQMAEQFQATGDAIASGNATNLFDQWMKASGLGEKPKPNAPSIFDNPFTQSLQAMFTQQGKSTAQTSNVLGSNPFMQMFETMKKGAEPAEATKPETNAGADALASAFNQMFDSGIEVQKNYQKNMDSIFQSYFSNLKPDGDKTK